MPRNKLLQIRRGSASEWSSTNPELAAGEFGLDTTNNRLKVGPGNWNNLDYLFLNETVIRIKNEHISNISKGQAVYIYSEDSGIIGCKLLLADGNTSKHLFAGLVSKDTIVNNISETIYFGKLTGVNTTGSGAADFAVGGENWSFGDKLYVSSSEIGKLSNTKQTFSIPVGLVLVVDASDGEILVNPNTASSSLKDLEDISLSELSNENLLKYNSNLSIWENDDAINGGVY